MSIAITPELLADIRAKAEKAAPHFDHEKGEYKPLGEVLLSCHKYVAATNPKVVLALLDRIDALEHAIEEMRDNAMERSERADT